MDKVIRYTRYCCPKCNTVSAFEEWDVSTRNKYKYAASINSSARSRCEFKCPDCWKVSPFHEIAEASGIENTIEGYPKLVIKKAVDYHPGAVGQLINVLYEQALRQAELKLEIEAALERFDMDEYYRLVAKYLEDEQLGARIG